MASTALVAVAVGGGISLGLVASCSLRAAGDSRRLGRRLVLLRRGGAEVSVSPRPFFLPLPFISW